MNYIITKPVEAFVAVADQAKQEQSRLLAVAQDQKDVTNATEALYATETLKMLKTFSRQIEDSRADVSAPILDLTRKINAIAKELTGPIEIEAKRISRNLGDFQAAQQQRLREAEENARQERARIEQEAKLKLEEAAAKSRTESSFAKKEDKIMREMFTEVARTRTEVAAIQQQRPEGIALRQSIKFEVTDIHALYAANRMLVKLEPNTAIINAALKQLSEGETIAGIRHWKEANVNVR